jgi:hypothetical protein
VHFLRSTANQTRYRFQESKAISLSSWMDWALQTSNLLVVTPDF